MGVKVTITPAMHVTPTGVASTAAYGLGALYGMDKGSFQNITAAEFAALT